MRRGGGGGGAYNGDTTFHRAQRKSSSIWKASDAARLVLEGAVPHFNGAPLLYAAPTKPAQPQANTGQPPPNLHTG